MSCLNLLFPVGITETLPTQTTQELTQGCLYATNEQCQDISPSSAPRRSASCVRRLQSVQGWYRFVCGYGNKYLLTVVGRVDFPPDKDDSSLEAETPEPERPLTSPVRQRHRVVGGYSSSSEESRSSRASTTPSLHHSYETLNISDTGIIVSHPHRPAPKPPGNIMVSRCQLQIGQQFLSDQFFISKTLKYYEFYLRIPAKSPEETDNFTFRFRN